MHNVKIADGWANPGKRGRLLTTVLLTVEWGVVLWDGESEPTCFPMNGLDREE